MKKLFLILALVFVVLVSYALFANNSTTEKEVVYVTEPVTFIEDDRQFTVQYSDGADYAQISLSGVQYELERSISASGAKYTNDDESIVFWEHQGEAMLEVRGEAVFEAAMPVGENDENLLTFNIEPERKPCTGEGEMECLIVNGEYFYDSIDGFEFESGYSYELIVERTERESVPADASVYEYRLVEVVSKEAVDKDDSKLPEGTVAFGGTLEAVNTSCFADGICSATVEGKTIILLRGWSRDTVGEVRFEDGIGGLESHIGKPVNVFAAEAEDGYTLYGSEDYYIEAGI